MWGREGGRGGKRGCGEGRKKEEKGMEGKRREGMGGWEGGDLVDGQVVDVLQKLGIGWEKL